MWVIDPQGHNTVGISVRHSKDIYSKVEATLVEPPDSMPRDWR